MFLAFIPGRSVSCGPRSTMRIFNSGLPSEIRRAKVDPTGPLPTMSTSTERVVFFISRPPGSGLRSADSRPTAPRWGGGGVGEKALAEVVLHLHRGEAVEILHPGMALPFKGHDA